MSTNKFNTNISSKIIELQSKYLFDKLFEKFKNVLTAEQVVSLVSETIERYYVSLGRPLLIKRLAESNHLPFLEEFNDMADEIFADMVILYGEIERIGTTFSEHFNYAQTERMRINNRIKNVASLTTDLNLLANETTPNSIYIRDSFNDQTNLDLGMVMGRPVQISTREGIVTLARVDTLNQSASASIKLVQGDGELGTKHLVKQVNVETDEDEFSINAVYVSDQTPNDDPSVILDGRPDTVFEYQMVNIKPEDIINVCKGYDVEWAKGKPSNDRLRVKIVIELSKVADVNWININPYHPANSTGKVIVYSIRTSEDGFDYQALYDGGNYILNAEINTTPQTYRQDEIFDGKNDFSASKFSGQGVWSFGTRKAKYVEVVLDQVEPYNETIGHTFYERVTKIQDPNDGQVRETSVRIPSSQVPQTILESPPGKYVIKDTEYIRKGIDVFNGWRYVIGVRDLNIMSYQFTEKSEMLTKKFTTDKAIKEIMLYSNEKIPSAFLEDLSKANDWIQYYISLDDVNWHRISPVHHSPVSGGEFPPKIYEVNSSNVDLGSSFQLHKGYLTTEQPPKSIRLKVVMQRPTNITSAESYTPILEDYSLRIVFEEERAQ